jgi:hypothetical protein
MTRAHLTLRSSNSKTGPIPVSTTDAATCPETCAFKGAGCYAEGGPLAMHWAKVSEGSRGTSWEQFCSQVAALPPGQLWRHNQAGDLPGVGEQIDLDELAQLILANKGRRGFTYTHKPVGAAHGVNRWAVELANAEGFTVNISANNPRHADAIADLGVKAPITTVLPSDTEGHTARTPLGRKIVVCPATYRENVTCESCQACANNGPERHLIGFPAHGARAGTVDRNMEN